MVANCKQSRIVCMSFRTYNDECIKLLCTNACSQAAGVGARHDLYILSSHDGGRAFSNVRYIKHSNRHNTFTLALLLCAGCHAFLSFSLTQRNSTKQKKTWQDTIAGRPEKN